MLVDAHRRLYTPEERRNLEQFIIFRLGDDEFGINVEGVKEVVKTKSIAAILDSPRFIKGIMNHRGDAIVTIDLKSRFFLQPLADVKSEHIIVTRNHQNRFGMLVDEVLGIVRVQKNDIKDTPAFVTKIHEEYVEGVITVDDRLVILLDLNRVISEDELIRLSEIQRTHASIHANPYK